MLKVPFAVLYFCFFTIVYLVLIQSFYYMNVLAPLYVMSKVGVPVLGVLASLTVGYYCRLPRAFFAIVLLYLVLLTASPLIAYFNYSQPLYLGLLAQIKLINVFLFFFTFVFFSEFKVEESYFLYVVLATAFFSVFFYLSLYFVIPPRYLSAYEEFSAYSSSKGERWMVPYHHILYAYFVAVVVIARCKAVLMKVVCIIYVVVFMYYFVLIFQQKMMVVALLAVTLLWVYKRVFSGSFIWLVCGTLVVCLPLVYYFRELVGALLLFEVDSLGIRGRTISTIFDAFSEGGGGNLIFGFGGLSVLSAPNLQTLYGINFWLSDVGFVGILFEYGLLGLLVSLIVWWLLLRWTFERGEGSNPCVVGAKMYILFQFIQAPLVPDVIYGVGEIFFFIAVVEYFRQRGGGYERLG